MKRGPKRSDPVVRFWSKVAQAGPGDCWPWIARRNAARGGYGAFDDEHRHTWRAHRYAFFLMHGYAPALVRHTCDNPACCNPAHLLEGTQQDNAHDMVSRGRSCVGERHGMVKLTEDQVRAILASDMSHTALGLKYGVSRATIELVRKRVNWSHIDATATPIVKWRRKSRVY